MLKMTVSPNTINPVDWYNFNCVQYTVDEILKLKSFHQSGHDAITYVKNKQDKHKRMIVIEDGFFVAKMENGINMAIGEKYTPFMMLQKFVFKEDFSLAFSHVMYEMMNNKSDYIRVGIKYIKKIRKTDVYGISRLELKGWDKMTIVDDHGKEFLSNIEKFDDFTIEPNNKEYKQIVGNCYNVYAPFDHKSVEDEEYIGEEQWYWTNILIKHIFGEQYDLGLKYLKVLYDLPKQTLPILVLISEERQTGKTTFVNYLTQLFGANTVILNPKDIADQFNGSYADKNLIIIEESYFENKQSLEKLKNLSTQKKILVNTKFIQHYSIPFFAKLVITSNDENKFSRVDNPEIRYWVRKIPSLKGKENHKILDDLVNEIPYFLRHLDNMEPIDTTKSRMVFTADEIRTEALDSVKKESRSELHKELEMYLDNHCLQNKNIQRFYFISIDIKKKWFEYAQNYKSSYIHKVIKTELKLTKETEEPTRYKPLEEEGILSETKVGRPFFYDNKYFGMSDEKIKEETDSFFDVLDEDFE